NFTTILVNTTYHAIFEELNLTHNWKIENINQGQVIYVEIDSTDELTNLDVFLFRPSGTSYTNILQFTGGSTKKLASWLSPGNGDWIIQVNYTEDLSSSNFTYSLSTFSPSTAYSIETAELISNISINLNFTMNHESHYWKVLLHENQNGIINLKEITPLSLFETTMTIFREQNPQNPIFDNLIQGSVNHSWNAPATDTYYIIIKHNPDDSIPIGDYNISFSAETSSYNFESAEKIPYNKTVSINVRQGFSPRKRYYFWFKVNISRTEVNIRVFEENFSSSTILDYAIVELFDEGLQKPKFSLREEVQARDGEINISDTLDMGIYYLTISPESIAVGTFYIFLEFHLPRPFIWNFPAIILSIILIVIFPSYLVYLDSKGRWYRINQWNSSTSVSETFKIFRDSFRGIYNIKEVPNDSILIRVASIPFSTYSILNFVESSERETLVFSKRISRKYELGIFFLIGLLIFDALNIVFYGLFSIHFLPFYFSGLTPLILFLSIPSIILVIIVLFANVSSYITYSQVNNRIRYIIQNFEEMNDESRSSLSMDPVQAAKSVNYVRVLWNQARHAFKDHNYELFVIKADAAVKNLLSTRYKQICFINPKEKTDFQTQVEELRKRGFDLPNDKKIAHFRNIRNRIVHSSVTLGEKESVDCFAYYSTFITRLGLRPT
ncbi:MAG: hypothetical protein ACXABI_17160, partial [Candidatus Hodarchaeales archaeon]